MDFIQYYITYKSRRISQFTLFAIQIRIKTLAFRPFIFVIVETFRDQITFKPQIIMTMIYCHLKMSSVQSYLTLATQ